MYTKRVKCLFGHVVPRACVKTICRDGQPRHASNPGKEAIGQTVALGPAKSERTHLAAVILASVMHRE
jgi:hypothetical protein